VPIAVHRVAECPFYALPCQASLDLRIVGDMEIVVVIDETVAKGREIHADNKR
jgi:hypothetical protein